MPEPAPNATPSAKQPATLLAPFLLLLVLPILATVSARPGLAAEAAQTDQAGQADQAGSDAPSVDALVARVTAGLGGEEAWQATRYLVFEFAGRRSHWWDRFTGRHRVEGTTQDGAHYVVLENVHDQGKAGRAWLDGEPVSGDEAAKLVQKAYATWVNDTFWLISPYKLRDPGVHLEAAGQETVDGVTYDKLHLSFDDVGLTPGDQYWMFINPETGRIDRWEYVLQSQEPPPTAWKWLEWQRYGAGIWLSDLRTQVGGNQIRLTLGPIEVPDWLPDSVFTSPEPLGPLGGGESK